MFARDAERMARARKRQRVPAPGQRRAGWHHLPAGPRARRQTLGMDGVCQNSLDAVSDRDFAIQFTAAASLCMVHVSRLSKNSSSG